MGKRILKRISISTCTSISIYIFIYMNHFAVYLQLTQRCKSTIVQGKIFNLDLLSFCMCHCLTLVLSSPVTDNQDISNSYSTLFLHHYSKCYLIFIYVSYQSNIQMIYYMLLVSSFFLLTFGFGKQHQDLAIAEQELKQKKEMGPLIITTTC